MSSLCKIILQYSVSILNFITEGSNVFVEFKWRTVLNAIPSNGNFQNKKAGINKNKMALY